MAALSLKDVSPKQVSPLLILRVTTERVVLRDLKKKTTKNNKFTHLHASLEETKALHEALLCGPDQGPKEALVFDPQCPLPLTKNSKVPIFREST